MLRNAPIRYKILASFALPILIFIISGFVVRSEITKLENVQRNFIQGPYQLVQNLHQVKSVLLGTSLQMRELQVGFGFNNMIQVNDARGKMRAYEDEYAKLISQLEQNPSISADNLAKLKKAASYFLDTHANYVDAVTTRGDTRTAFEQGVEPARLQIWPVFEPIFDNANQAATRAKAAVESAAKSVVITLISAIAISIIAALVTGLLVSRRLSAPIQEMMNALNQLERGVLSSRTSINSRDETGQMAQSLNASLARLQEVIRELQGASGRIDENSVSLKSITDRVHSSADQQMHETAQVASAVEEISSTVAESARYATEVATASNQVNDQAQLSLSHVGQTQQVIQTLSGELQNSFKLASELKGHSDQIVQILDVIKGVAEQTNLLALNAAIEAARAGDQGRGFAVVADEVRSLAQRTQESTAEIGNMLEQLNHASNAVLESMSICTEHAAETVRSSEQGQQAIEEISQAISNVNDMITQIATANQQQSSVSEEIAQAVQRINQLAESNLEISQEANNASQELHLEGENLRTQTRFFAA